jgi:hypothetical protein
MKNFWLFRFWIADKQHRTWKQMELFACSRKIKAVQRMHEFWKRFKQE